MPATSDAQAKTERISLAVSPQELEALEFVRALKDLDGVGVVLRGMSLKQAVRYARRKRKELLKIGR